MIYFGKLYLLRQDCSVLNPINLSQTLKGKGHKPDKCHILT